MAKLELQAGKTFRMKVDCFVVVVFFFGGGGGGRINPHDCTEDSFSNLISELLCLDIIG